MVDSDLIREIITPEIAAKLRSADHATQMRVAELLKEIREAQTVERAQTSFIDYVTRMWPSFIAGRHHKIMARTFDRIVSGDAKRVIINMAPRHTKSEFGSNFLPSYFLGHHPNRKVIQTSHTAELAQGFGRKVRDMIDTAEYREIFPGTRLSETSKAAGRWSTAQGGDYFAIGVGGAVTGKGADLLIIDDPHALEISTPIPTPNGFVEIQHLRVGDEVFGPDGRPTKVVAKSDIWHDRELYSVITDDGQEILCDAKHLWGVNSDTCLAKANVNSHSAQYLAEWPRKSKPIIPRHQPVEYPEADLPIDPWVLGAWLGDGTASSGRMTAHPDDQPYMREQFELAGYKTGPLTKDGWTFTVYGLHQQLADVGVLNNKHVPEPYLTASVAQRMALLQGLIDTDGSVIKTGQAGFYNTNPDLVDAVVELLHSLGVKCQRRSYEDNRGRWGSSKTQHRVMFRLQDCARMPRKNQYSRTPMDKRSRSITSEPTGVTGSVQCITVEREDGLFLAGRGYVVTHNSEQEAQMLDPSVYDKVYEWYTSGPRQRLQPGGAIVIIMCMTGDTGVLRPDGSETPLRDIRVGDKVATYENGQMAVSRINNHRSSGVDSVLKIQTESGRILRANARHPFLVNRSGVETWVRLQNLKVGDTLVSLQGVGDRQGQRQSRGSARHANPKTATTGKTLTLPSGLLAAMAGGRGRVASAAGRLSAKGCVPGATKEQTRSSRLQSKTGRGASNTDTASPLTSTMQWLLSATTDAIYAAWSLMAATPAPIGAANSALTTAMSRARSEGFSATTATWPSDTASGQTYSGEQQTISLDTIISITPDGREEVFDVEVDRTENFIANGVVSHNTRWHLRDLTGRILKEAAKRGTADQWEVIEFPAILPSGNPLWPEFWSIDELLALKEELGPKFNAQYQQNPVSEEGALVKRSDWRRWEKPYPPDCEFVIQSWDTAFLKNQRADYSACTTWGVFYVDNEEGKKIPNVILLDAYKERLEFPALKKMAAEMYNQRRPDAFLVEGKAAGMPLIFELRAMGIPVTEYTPSRGNDKIARVNSITDLFASGVVWAPDTRFADEVIEEFASFPAGEHDDLVDSSTQALIRFRQGGFIPLESDEQDEDFEKVKRIANYY